MTTAGDTGDIRQPYALRPRSRPNRHNLDQLRWQPYAADEAAMPDDLMREYVLHLERRSTRVRNRIRQVRSIGGSA